MMKNLIIKKQALEFIRKILAVVLAGVFLFTDVFGWAKEEELFSAGTENMPFSSGPANKSKLSPALRTSSADFKELYKAVAICRFIEEKGISSLQGILPLLSEVKKSFKEIQIAPYTLPLREIIIEIPGEGLAVRYFDPSIDSVITPFPDVSEISTKDISPQNIGPRLRRQIIHLGGRHDELRGESGETEDEKYKEAKRKFEESIPKGRRPKPPFHIGAMGSGDFMPQIEWIGDYRPLEKQFFYSGDAIEAYFTIGTNRRIEDPGENIKAMVMSSIYHKSTERWEDVPIYFIEESEYEPGKFSYRFMWYLERLKAPHRHIFRYTFKASVDGGKNWKYANDPRQDWVAIPEEIKRAVVRIEPVRDLGGKGIGSGVVFWEDKEHYYILSSSDVTNPEKKDLNGIPNVQVILSGQTRLEGEIILATGDYMKGSIVKIKKVNIPRESISLLDLADTRCIGDGTWGDAYRRAYGDFGWMGGSEAYLFGISPESEKLVHVGSVDWGKDFLYVLPHTKVPAEYCGGPIIYENRIIGIIAEHDEGSGSKILAYTGEALIHYLIGVLAKGNIREQSLLERVLIQYYETAIKIENTEYPRRTLHKDYANNLGDIAINSKSDDVAREAVRSLETLLRTKDLYEDIYPTFADNLEKVAKHRLDLITEDTVSALETAMERKNKYDYFNYRSYFEALREINTVYSILVIAKFLVDDNRFIREQANEEMQRTMPELLELGDVTRKNSGLLLPIVLTVKDKDKYDELIKALEFWKDHEDNLKTLLDIIRISELKKIKENGFNIDDIGNLAFEIIKSRVLSYVNNFEDLFALSTIKNDNYAPFRKFIVNDAIDLRIRMNLSEDYIELVTIGELIDEYKKSSRDSTEQNSAIDKTFKDCLDRINPSIKEIIGAKTISVQRRKSEKAEKIIKDLRIGMMEYLLGKPLSISEKPLLEDRSISKEIFTIFAIALTVELSESFEEGDKIRDLIIEALNTLFSSYDPQDKDSISKARNKLSEWLCNLKENKAAIDKLTTLGYDPRLWTMGIELDLPVTKGITSEKKEEMISKSTYEMVEIALSLGLKEVESTKLTLDYAKGINTHEKAKHFYEIIKKSLNTIPEDSEDRLIDILDFILRTQKLEIGDMKEADFRVTIKKDLLKEAAAGIGIPGCFNPRGIHREMPLVHAMEANSFFMQVFDAANKQKANAVIVLTDKGAYVYSGYNYSSYDMETIFASALKELSKYAPSVILSGNSAGITELTPYLNEAKNLSITKPAILFTDQYFDTGTVDTKTGDLTINRPAAYIMTKDSVDAKGGFEAEEKNLSKGTYKENEALAIPWQTLVNKLIGNSMKEHLSIIKEIKNRLSEESRLKIDEEFKNWVRERIKSIKPDAKEGYISNVLKIITDFMTDNMPTIMPTPPLPVDEEQYEETKAAQQVKDEFNVSVEKQARKLFSKLKEKGKIKDILIIEDIFKQWGEAAIHLVPLIKAMLNSGTDIKEITVVSDYPDLIEAVGLEVKNKIALKCILPADFKRSEFLGDKTPDLIIKLGIPENLTEFPAKRTINGLAWVLASYIPGRLSSLPERIRYNLANLGLDIHPEGSILTRRAKKEGVIFVNPHSFTNRISGENTAAWVRLISELINKGYEVGVNAGADEKDYDNTDKIRNALGKLNNKVKWKKFPKGSEGRSRLIKYISSEVEAIVTIDTAIFHITRLYSIPTVVITSSVSDFWIPAYEKMDFRKVSYSSFSKDVSETIKKLEDLIKGTGREIPFEHYENQTPIKKEHREYFREGALSKAEIDENKDRLNTKGIKVQEVMVAGKPINFIVEASLVKIIEDKDVIGMRSKEFLENAIKIRGPDLFKDLKADKTYYLDLIQKSSTLGGNGERDFYSYINAILKQILNKNRNESIITQALLGVLVTHELRHEAGIGNSKKDEAMLTDEDIEFIFRYLKHNPVLSIQFRNLLSEFVEEEGLLKAFSVKNINIEIAISKFKEDIANLVKTEEIKEEIEEIDKLDIQTIKEKANKIIKEYSHGNINTLDELLNQKSSGVYDIHDLLGKRSCRSILGMKSLRQEGMFEDCLPTLKKHCKEICILWRALLAAKGRDATPKTPGTGIPEKIKKETSKISWPEGNYGLGAEALHSFVKTLASRKGEEFDKCIKELLSDKKILEHGCGWPAGLVEILHNRYNLNITGIDKDIPQDLDSPYLKHENITDLKMWSDGEFDVVIGAYSAQSADGFEIYGKSEGFKDVAAYNQQITNEINRVLKPGGKYYLIFGKDKRNHTALGQFAQLGFYKEEIISSDGFLVCVLTKPDFTLLHEKVDSLLKGNGKPIKLEEFRTPTYLMNGHNGCLDAWPENLSDAVLLHFDSHQDYDKLGTLSTIDNFITEAVLKRGLSEIYHVVPERYPGLYKLNHGLPYSFYGAFEEIGKKIEEDMDFCLVRWSTEDAADIFTLEKIEKKENAEAFLRRIMDNKRSEGEFKNRQAGVHKGGIKIHRVTADKLPDFSNDSRKLLLDFDEDYFHDGAEWRHQYNTWGKHIPNYKEWEESPKKDKERILRDIDLIKDFLRRLEKQPEITTIALSYGIRKEDQFTPLQYVKFITENLLSALKSVGQREARQFTPEERKIEPPQPEEGEAWDAIGDIPTEDGEGIAITELKDLRQDRPRISRSFKVSLCESDIEPRSREEIEKRDITPSLEGQPLGPFDLFIDAERIEDSAIRDGFVPYIFVLIQNIVTKETYYCHWVEDESWPMDKLLISVNEGIERLGNKKQLRVLVGGAAPFISNYLYIEKRADPLKDNEELREDIKNTLKKRKKVVEYIKQKGLERIQECFIQNLNMGLDLYFDPRSSTAFVDFVQLYPEREPVEIDDLIEEPKQPTTAATVESADKDTTLKTPDTDTRAQIGKKAKGEIIMKDNKPYLKVTDSKGNIHELDLEKTNLDARTSIEAFISKEDMNQSHKELILNILSLLEKSPPLYTFSTLIEDLFSYTSKEHNLIALHQDLKDNPIAIFHEIAEYLIESNILELALKEKNTLTVSLNASKPIEMGIYTDTWQSLRDEDSNEDKWTDWPINRLNKNPHYLLRALARQMFGDKDRELTQEIKKEQQKLSEYSGSITGKENNDILDLVIKLKDKNSGVRHTTVCALKELFKSPREIPHDILDDTSKELVRRLSDADPDVRFWATSAFGELFKSPREIPHDILDDRSKELVEFLNTGNPDIIRTASSVLKELFKSPREIPHDILDNRSKELIELLKDGYSVTRSYASDTLGGLFNSPREIPEDILYKRSRKLVGLLKHKHPGVRKSASSTLEELFKSPREIPQPILDDASKELAGRLSDADPDVRFWAASAFRELFKSPRKILQNIVNIASKKLVKLLKDKDFCIRHRTASALRELFKSPRKIPQAILDKASKELVDLLKDEDSTVRSRAAPALGVLLYINKLDMSILRNVGLESIDFRNGGDSPNTISSLTEGLLTGVAPLKMPLPSGEIPKLEEGKIRDIPQETSLPTNISELLEQEPYLVLGRTLVYKIKGEDGKEQYVAFKFLKEGENPGLLEYESQLFAYFNTHKKTLGLQSNYPTPCLINGKRVVRVKSLSQTAIQALQSQVDKEGQALTIDRINGHTLMAYEISDPTYFTYLNDPNLIPEQFQEGTEKCLNDLFILARHGIIHKALIELFHNLTQRGREERGIYLWMVDIMREFGTRAGAGRLHAWTKAVRYPNLRLSGLSDLAEFSLIDDIIQPDNIHNPFPRDGVLARRLQERFSDKTKNIYLANYLGDYLLSYILILGSYFREKDQLHWDNPEEVRALGERVKEVFKNAFSAFTQNQDQTYLENLTNSIDWARLAKQMAFFMAKGDIYAEYLLKKDEKIFKEIYGEGVNIGFAGDYPPSWGWIDKNGKKGWYVDGENPDLGPANGPLPLQELVKALYIFSGFMLKDIERTLVLAETPDDAQPDVLKTPGTSGEPITPESPRENLGKSDAEAISDALRKELLDNYYVEFILRHISSVPNPEKAADRFLKTNAAKSFVSLINKLDREIGIPPSNISDILLSLLTAPDPKESIELFIEFIKALYTIETLRDHDMIKILMSLSTMSDLERYIKYLLDPQIWPRFLKFIEIFISEGFSDGGVGIFLNLPQGFPDNVSLSLEELVTVLYLDEYIEDHHQRPVQDTTPDLFRDYQSNPQLVKVRYLLAKGRYRELKELIRKEIVIPQTIIEAFLLNQQRSIIFQATNLLFDYMNSKGISYQKPLHPKLSCSKEDLGKVLRELGLNTTIKDIENMLKEQGFRLCSYSDKILILPIAFDILLSAYRGSLEYDHTEASFLTYDILIAIIRYSGIERTGAASAFHEFDLGFTMLEGRNDWATDSQESLAFFYLSPLPEYSRRRTVTLKDKSVAGHIQQLLNWQLRERRAKQNIYKILHWVEEGRLSKEQLNKAIELLKEQLNILKTQCGLKEPYYEAVYGYLNSTFFAQLKRGYQPDKSNLSVLIELLKKAMRKIRVVSVSARNGNPAQKVIHPWLAKDKTLLDYFKNEEAIRRNTFDDIDVSTIFHKTKPIIIEPCLSSHGLIYDLVKKERAGSGRKILIFNADAHSDDYAGNLDASWAKKLDEEGGAITIHLPSYYDGGRKKDETDWKTRKGGSCLQRVLSIYEKYKDTVEEVWVTIDYDFFSLCDESFGQSRVTIYHLTPEEIDREIAALIAFFEENKITIHRVVPSLPSSSVEIEYLALPAGMSKTTFKKEVTDKINSAFEELSKRQSKGNSFSANQETVSDSGGTVGLDGAIIVKIAKEKYGYDIEQGLVTSVLELIKAETSLKELMVVTPEADQPQLLSKLCIIYNAARLPFVPGESRENVINFAKNRLAEIQLAKDIVNGRFDIEELRNKRESNLKAHPKLRFMGISSVFKDVLEGNIGALSCLVKAIEQGFGWHELGFDINLWNADVGLTWEFSSEMKEAMRKLVAESGIRLTTHAPLFNMMPGFKPTREQMLQAYKDTIDISVELGAESMVLHIHDMGKDDIDMLRDMIFYAKEKGIIILLENTKFLKDDTRADTYHSASDLLRIIDKLIKAGVNKKDFEVVLDVAHLNLSKGAGSTEEQVQTCLDTLVSSGVEIAKVHINQNDGQQDTHWGISDKKGTVPNEFAIRKIITEAREVYGAKKAKEEIAIILEIAVPFDEKDREIVEQALQEINGINGSLTVENSGKSDVEAILATLETIPLFKVLSKESIERIADELTECTYAKDKEIIKEGDYADSLYIIAKGNVAVKVRTVKPDEEKSIELSEGGIIGEMAIFDKDRKRSASVFADSDKVVLWKINYGIIEKLMDESIPFKIALEDMRNIRFAQQMVMLEKGELPEDIGSKLTEWVEFVFRQAAEIAVKRMEQDGYWKDKTENWEEKIAVFVTGSVGRKDELVLASDIDFFIIPATDSDIYLAKALYYKIIKVFDEVLSVFKIKDMVLLKIDRELEKQFNYFRTPRNLKDTNILEAFHTSSGLPPGVGIDIKPDWIKKKETTNIGPNPLRDAKIVAGSKAIEAELHEVLEETIYSDEDDSFNKALIQDIEDSSKIILPSEEYKRFNIKDSAMRVIQYFVWLCRAKFVEVREKKSVFEVLQGLQEIGELTKDETKTLANIYRNCIEIRNNLFFIKEVKDLKEGELNEKVLPPLRNRLELQSQKELIYFLDNLTGNITEMREIIRSKLKSLADKGPSTTPKTPSAKDATEKLIISLNEIEAVLNNDNIVADIDAGRKEGLTAKIKALCEKIEEFQHILLEPDAKGKLKPTSASRLLGEKVGDRIINMAAGLSWMPELLPMQIDDLPELKNSILSIYETIEKLRMVLKELSEEFTVVKNQIDYIDKNEALFRDMLGEGKQNVLVRVPVEAIGFVGIENIKAFLETFQKAHNGYIELYRMSDIEEADESVYQEYGLTRKQLPEDLKDPKRRTRANTVTLFAALKGDKIDEAYVKTRLGRLDMNPNNTILVPIGLLNDQAGLVRATILGLKIMDVARRLTANPDLAEDQAFKDDVQTRILQDLLSLYKIEDLKDLGPDDIIALASSENITKLINSLQKLIELLPITPINAEELRYIYEHAKAVITAA